MKLNQALFANFILLAIVMFLLAFAHPQEALLDKKITTLQKWTDVNLQEEVYLHLHKSFYAVADTTKGGKIVKQISDSLEKMKLRLPIEKVYLHTDRPVYSIGDTIWFKAYLVDHARHKASNISNLLYVELIDQDARLVERISIRIKDGTGWGQIPLRKIQYQDGEFMLRAYTMWMQNFGFDFFFSQRFFIGTQEEDAWLVKSNVDVELIEQKNQLKISLYLNRLDKVSSPVAFKDLEVKIYDDNRAMFKEEMRTDINGHLLFTRKLKNGMNGRRLRLQLMSLESKDHNKLIQVPLVINRTNKIDLQFLPEGGKLVAGIKTVLGFKAVGEDGRGTFVSGSISDSKGNKIARFSTLHRGIGSVVVTPKAEERYVARVDVPQGVTEDFPLPKVEDYGTVLHVKNAEKADDIRITLGGLTGIGTNAEFYLIGTANGKICYSQKIETGQTDLSIAKKLFPSGIARFTLFNGVTPLNERMVFIDNLDQLRFKITPHKSRYGKRDSVSLDIEVKDKSGLPVQGNFSLSVTDNSQVKPDSLGDYSLPVSLLLNAELKGDYGINVLETFKTSKFKGEIESPGYYINRADSNAWKALDNLMLTEGWTDYKWEKVFSPDKPIYFKAQNTFDITGRVKNTFNQSIANNTVMAFSQNPPFVKKALTDKSGCFVFKDLLLIDSGSFFFQVTRPNGKPLALGELVIDRPFDTFYTPAAYRYPILRWYVNSDTTNINQARLRAEQAIAGKPEVTGNLLKEVVIKGKKIIRGSWNGFPGNADYVFDEHDIRESGLNNLYDFLRQNIPGIRLHFSQEVHEMAVLDLTFNDRLLDTKIDGRPLQIDMARGDVGRIEELSKYQLTNIRGIELIYSTKYINTGRPKLIITTYNGKGGIKNFNGGSNAFRPLPVTAPKIFYRPKYIVKTPVKLTDYRATVHWEPNIITDQNGKARVSFYTSDVADGFTLNIQGIGIGGSLGNKLYEFNHY